jgi:hypothetical protein
VNNIKSLSRVRSHARCPSCGSARLLRSSEPQNTGVSMNGESLWELVEACTVCTWAKHVPNVKIGV